MLALMTAVGVKPEQAGGVVLQTPTVGTVGAIGFALGALHKLRIYEPDIVIDFP